MQQLHQVTVKTGDQRKGSRCTYSVHFSPLTDSSGRLDDSAEILFQSFLQEAVVNSYGMGWDVHFLTLSIQRFMYMFKYKYGNDYFLQVT